MFQASRHNSDGTLVSADLIPNGSNVLVTRANVHQYIHLLANYKQNVQIAEAARALVSGFRSVVPLEWIRMFSGVELQKLISGERQRINIADLKAHCNYNSGKILMLVVYGCGLEYVLCVQAMRRISPTYKASGKLLKKCLWRIREISYVLSPHAADSPC